MGPKGATRRPAGTVRRDMVRHVALVGTTASGKSALALELARREPSVEIVSVDSMQVYRGMDIGTAKPTIDQRSWFRRDPRIRWLAAQV